MILSIDSGVMMVTLGGRLLEKFGHCQDRISSNGYLRAMVVLMMVFSSLEMPCHSLSIGDVGSGISSKSAATTLRPSYSDLALDANLDEQKWKIGDCIGSGSYGTVHYLFSDVNGSGDRHTTMIGKRAWTAEELVQSTVGTTDSRKARAARCRYYWKVEAHCFSKLPHHPQLPPYYGTVRDDDGGYGWMLFGRVSSHGGIIEPNTNDDHVDDGPSTSLAKSLAHYMELDREHTANIVDTDQQQDEPQQRLPNLAKALQCDEENDDCTLDTLLTSLLMVLSHVHDSNIVHRDLKPSNILIGSQNRQSSVDYASSKSSLVLIDFGSAADTEPTIDSDGGRSIFGKSKKIYMGLEDEHRVAVSPVYCAPEVFIDLRKAPLAFDLSSASLIFCQLLFGYLEERVDAGFRQQLSSEANWDINLWLSYALASKVRPEGLEEALDYLGDRPGLWKLLQDMLQEDPERRPTAHQAQSRLKQILDRKDGIKNEEDYDKFKVLEEADGSFFAMVVDSLESCQVPSVSRPLHFVATFSRRKPLGLVFSEADDVDDGTESLQKKELWLEATKDAVPGEVFIRDIVPGGQADELGIFEIGDRLQGIGELAFSAGGFEKAVEMLQDQPRLAKNVRLHFDRLKVRDNQAISMSPASKAKLVIIDQGVWSTKGRRQTQEDAFVLHEIHDTKDRSVLLLGVMDGHGGTAASTKVSEELPIEVTNQLVVNRLPLDLALQYAWETVCRSYQQDCQGEDVCIADYDKREGLLKASTGSEDLIAGTTASIMALEETNGNLVALNCGDSRSLVITSDGKVQMATQDHTPETEEERLREGIAAGLDYSLPKCKLSKWTISAGNYEYSVGRSLEGPFVSSKGIVSDPDISTTNIGVNKILVAATDGCWEVMDSGEVALDLVKMRKQGMSARDAARSLCSMALDKGTSDNISAVVVYL